MLKLAAFTNGAFQRTVFYGVAPRNGRARTRYESDCTCVIGLLGLRFWTLALIAGIFWLVEEYDIVPVLTLFSYERGTEIKFSVVEKLF